MALPSSSLFRAPYLDTRMASRPPALECASEFTFRNQSSLPHTSLTLLILLWTPAQRIAPSSTQLAMPNTQESPELLPALRVLSALVSYQLRHPSTSVHPAAALLLKAAIIPHLARLVITDTLLSSPHCTHWAHPTTVPQSCPPNSLSNPQSTQFKPFFDPTSLL